MSPAVPGGRRKTENRWNSSPTWGWRPLTSVLDITSMFQVIVLVPARPGTWSTQEVESHRVHICQLATATSWPYREMRSSLVLRRLRNRFIWNPFICGWIFHRSEGREHLCEGAIPALVVRLYMTQQGSSPGAVFRLNLWHQSSSLPSFICVLLSQTKVDTAVMITSFLVIIRLSLLWLPLLCVAVRAPLWSFLNKFPVVPVLRMRARSPSSS